MSTCAMILTSLPWASDCEGRQLAEDNGLRRASVAKIISPGPRTTRGDRDDLPFYTRLHALPKVAEHLYPEGRPRSPEETAGWLKYTLASYEKLALGYLAVLRKEDGALIGRC